MSLLPLKTTVKPLDENKREQYVTYRMRTSTQDPNDSVTLNIRHFDYGNGVEWLSWRKQFEYIRNLMGWSDPSELYQNTRILQCPLMPVEHRCISIREKADCMLLTVWNTSKSTISLCIWCKNYRTSRFRTTGTQLIGLVEKYILTIRRKSLCDCKSFFASGWCCSHVMVTLKLEDDFNFQWLLRSLPARKPPGRPRKAPKIMRGDGRDDKQYDVSTLINMLTRSPGSVVGWKVMVKNEATADNGDAYIKNLTGVILPWDEIQENYYWYIKFDRNAAPKAKLGIIELAEVINYTYRSKYPFIQPS